MCDRWVLQIQVGALDWQWVEMQEKVASPNIYRIEAIVPVGLLFRINRKGDERENIAKEFSSTGHTIEERQHQYLQRPQTLEQKTPCDREVNEASLVLRYFQTSLNASE
jgi:hypothetical protein